MPDETSPTPDPFAIDRLRELFELMEKHGLTDVSLKHGEEHWRLRRGFPPSSVGAAPAYAPAPMPFAPPPPAPAGAPAAAPPAGEPADDGGLVIKSPTVGTFYTSPSPEDPPFVSVGSQVQPDTIVCIVEAMKVFNQIPAEVSGTITAVLVNSGDAIEFGQPLFKLRPN